MSELKESFRNLEIDDLMEGDARVVDDEYLRLEHLPDESLCEILSHVEDYDTIKSLMITSTRFRGLVPACIRRIESRRHVYVSYNFFVDFVFLEHVENIVIVIPDDGFLTNFNRLGRLKHAVFLVTDPIYPVGTVDYESTDRYNTNERNVFQRSLSLFNVLNVWRKTDISFTIFGNAGVYPQPISRFARERATKNQYYYLSISSSSSSSEMDGGRNPQYLISTDNLRFYKNLIAPEYETKIEKRFYQNSMFAYRFLDSNVGLPQLTLVNSWENIPPVDNNILNLKIFIGPEGPLFQAFPSTYTLIYDVHEFYRLNDIGLIYHNKPVGYTNTSPSIIPMEARANPPVPGFLEVYHPYLIRFIVKNHSELINRINSMVRYYNIVELGPDDSIFIDKSELNLYSAGKATNPSYLLKTYNACLDYRDIMLNSMSENTSEIEPLFKNQEILDMDRIDLNFEDPICYSRGEMLEFIRKYIFNSVNPEANLLSILQEMMDPVKFSDPTVIRTRSNIPQSLTLARENFNDFNILQRWWDLIGPQQEFVNFLRSSGGNPIKIFFDGGYYFQLRMRRPGREDRLIFSICPVDVAEGSVVKVDDELYDSKTLNQAYMEARRDMLIFLASNFDPEDPRFSFLSPIYSTETMASFLSIDTPTPQVQEIASRLGIDPNFATYERILKWINLTGLRMYLLCYVLILTSDPSNILTLPGKSYPESPLEINVDRITFNT